MRLQRVSVVMGGGGGGGGRGGFRGGGLVPSNSSLTRDKGQQSINGLKM